MLFFISFSLSFYSLAKNLIKIFVPNLITTQQWTYLDLFLPILLPTIDTSSIIPGGIPKIEGGIMLGRTSSDQNISAIGLIDENKNSSNKTLETITFKKRSLLKELETSTVPFYEEFYEFTTPISRISVDQNEPRGFFY